MKILEAYWEQIKWRKKQWQAVGLLIVLYFLFRTPLTELFDRYVVGLVLSKCTDKALNWFGLTAYAGLFLCYAWLLVVKCLVRNFQPSLVLHLVVVFACIRYWSERWDGSHYRIFPLFDIGKYTIAQLDPVYVLLSLAAVLVCYNYSVNRRFQAGNTFLKQDHPLHKIKSDLIGREPFYQNIIGRVKDIGFDTERSFAIGINSVWGYGKTSLLNILKEGVSSEKNIVCVDYNPWLSANKNNLTYDLFSVLEKELAKHVSNTDILLDYAKRVSKVDNDENKFKGVADLFQEEETLRDRFDGIAELIKMTGKRLIIFIDDLDRLDNEEVFEVLRLIRNVANFPRLLYIVAYDKYYLVNSLRTKHIFKPQQYLEKIFELELELPKIDNLKLKQVCHTSLKAGLARLTQLTPGDRSLIESQVYEMIFNSAALTQGKQAVAAVHFNQAFKSVRDILKFSNSFLFTLSLNNDEIYVPDLFLLELIKLANSDLYHLMASPDKYLTVHQGGTHNEYRLYRTPVPNAGTTDQFEIGSRIKPAYQLAIVKALLTAPGTTDHQHEKALVRVDNFKTYFIFAEPQGVMAFDEIDQLLRA